MFSLEGFRTSGTLETDKKKIITSSIKRKTPSEGRTFSERFSPMRGIYLKFLAGFAAEIKYPSVFSARTHITDVDVDVTFHPRVVTPANWSRDSPARIGGEGSPGSGMHEEPLSDRGRRW